MLEQVLKEALRTMRVCIGVELDCAEVPLRIECMD